jgi:hypothetical protein
MVAVQHDLDGTAVLPEAFTTRWSELGGPPLTVDEALHTHGGWWIAVRVNGKRFALCRRADAARAAEDLFEMTRTR